MQIRKNGLLVERLKDEKAKANGGKIEEEVFCLSDHGATAADPAGGVNELDGIQGSATSFALVTAGIFTATVWAGPIHVAVGQELMTVFAVELRHCLLEEVALLQKRQENVLSDLVVILGVCMREEVVGQAQLGEIVQEALMIALEDLPRGNALLVSLDSDRGTMAIRTGDHEDIVPP